TATKPNGNTVTSAYYANNLPYTVTENTSVSSGGTLVSSHTYAYDPDGNKSQDVEKLMSGDDSSSYLSHTLGYAYDPQDQVTQVTTDGTATESYTHDAEGDVTDQTVNGTRTSYDYVLGRLESATAGGTAADYNYDPLGRLDTVTTAATGQTIQSNTYDGFDNLASTSQLNTTTGSMDTTSYAYDSLNRMVSQTDAAGTSSFSYLGLSAQVASESDPGGVSKTYDYTPSGARLSQDTTGGTGATGYGYYSYNGHSDVEALTGASGTTTATYGYTAYGNPVTSMFTGADKNDATSSSSSTTQPYSSYRFNAMRWDGTSGSYDMGFRNYDPGINQFASRDMYEGALADAGLGANPFTGSLYAFGGGNPISNVELDGHMPVPVNGDGTSSGSESDGCPPPLLSCGAGSNPSDLTNLPSESSGSGSLGGTVVQANKGVPLEGRPNSQATYQDAIEAASKYFYWPSGAPKGFAYADNSYFFVRGTLNSGGQAVAIYASKSPVPGNLLKEWTDLRIPVYQLKGLDKLDSHGEQVADRESGQWSSIDDALSTNGICPRCVAAANNFISSSGLQVQKGSAGIANGEVVKTPTGGRFFPDTQNIYSAGAEGDAGAAGDAGGDLLGPLGFILQAIDAQRHGGFYSQGGCQVFGVPQSMCPYAQQPPTA
ncbi:MAG TPA: RHS repeat-associated core domain-containing protein, partial [Streptosporangiaceae bacterium]